MKRIVVKESLKESLSNLTSDWKLIKRLAPLVIIVGAYWLYLLLQHKESEGLIGVIMICLTPLACIFAAILAFMLIVFIIDTLLLIIHPCTYTFGFDESHFLLDKNSKTKLNLLHDDIKKIKYKNVTSDGNEVPRLMTIVYQKDGEENEVIIDLGHMSKSDQHDLLSFIRDFQSVKGKIAVGKQTESTKEPERRDDKPDTLEDMLVFGSTSTSKQSTHIPNYGEKKTPIKEEKQKRPHFIYEETLALCGVALSFVTDHGKVDTSAEAVVRHELQGIDIDEMRRLYQYWKKNMEDNLHLLKIYMAYDTTKKIYAAGFLAKVIKSRTDGGKNPAYVDAWKNVVKEVLRLPDFDSMDEAMRLFRYFVR